MIPNSIAFVCDAERMSVEPQACSDWLDAVSGMSGTRLIWRSPCGHSVRMDVNGWSIRAEVVSVR